MYTKMTLGAYTVSILKWHYLQ